jgi:DNA polymerase II small subunit
MKREDVPVDSRTESSMPPQEALSAQGETPGLVHVIWSETEEPHKIGVDDFVGYFNARFRSIERLLKGREELSGVRSISRITAKTAKENVSLIGMIVEKAETKNKNIMLSVEDATGKIQVLITPKRKELFTLAKDLVLDDIVGISGVAGNKIVFAENIVLPSIPLTREMKKAPAEAYAVFTGDIHIGSTAFLDDEFERFIAWLEGKSGSPRQREIAAKTKYVFIMGDLVEGIGIYPGQEEELTIREIRKQYSALAVYLRRIPSHMQMIILPGNHDAGRISEPQLPLYADFAGELYALQNVHMVSNPAYVNIGAEGDFSGLDVLLYHGFSFPYYADHVPSIKDAGGMKRADLIMKFLLQRRHLAPTHASSMYIPYSNRDPLFISRVPDLFVSGHIHVSTVANFRGVTLINSSCWTKMTEYQEKRGIEPQPGRVPVMNLQTREVKILNFLKEEAHGEL